MVAALGVAIQYWLDSSIDSLSDPEIVIFPVHHYGAPVGADFRPQELGEKVRNKDSEPKRRRTPSNFLEDSKPWVPE